MEQTCATQENIGQTNTVKVKREEEPRYLQSLPRLQSGETPHQVDPHIEPRTYVGSENLSSECAMTYPTHEDFGQTNTARIKHEGETTSCCFHSMPISQTGEMPYQVNSYPQPGNYVGSDYLSPELAINYANHENFGQTNTVRVKHEGESSYFRSMSIPQTREMPFQVNSHPQPGTYVGTEYMSPGSVMSHESHDNFGQINTVRVKREEESSYSQTIPVSHSGETTHQVDSYPQPRIYVGTEYLTHANHENFGQTNTVTFKREEEPDYLQALPIPQSTATPYQVNPYQQPGTYSGTEYPTPGSAINRSSFPNIQQMVALRAYPQRQHRKSSTKLSDRIIIRNAYKSGLTPKEIAWKFDYSLHQVYYALAKPLNPRINRRGSKPAIPPTKAAELVAWLESDPSHRYIPYRLVPAFAPELNLHKYGMKAIRTAFKSQGYERRLVKSCSKTPAQHDKQMRVDYLLN
ncbi:hypothetical protein K3495_g9362 [Podosphaera aphanis]|nr:hypothetical protein K3495_g9362 [Podosphaera aphanis]